MVRCHSTVATGRGRERKVSVQLLALSNQPEKQHSVISSQPKEKSFRLRQPLTAERLCASVTLHNTTHHLHIMQQGNSVEAKIIDKKRMIPLSIAAMHVGPPLAL
jgi:hypothetical protein